MQFRASSVLHSAAVVSAAAFFGLYFAACSQTVSADDSSDEEAAVTSSSSKGKSDGSSSEKNKSSSSKKSSGSSDSKGNSDDDLDEDCVGEPGKPWDGTTAKEFACGAGTKLSPYIILTAEQLAHLSFIVGSLEKGGSYFKLGADILLNEGEIIDEKGALVADSSKIHKWTPIGNSNVAFEGVFDGNGHTVSGMFINTTSSHNGLFGNVSGTVQNLTVENGWVNGGGGSAGVIGVAVDEAKVIGANNYASVVGTGHGVGGVVGSKISNYYQKTAKIENCSNFGVIKGKEFVGGVVGDIGNYADVSNVSNDGTIEGESYVAGIAGGLGMHTTMSKAFNKGNISGNSYTAGIAGFAGYSHGSANSKYGTLDRSINYGKIEGTVYTAGVLGAAACYNVLSVGNEGDIVGTNNVGGVSGHNKYVKTQALYNSGDIFGTSRVGGVIGYNQEGVTSSAYSTGKVDGDSLVGLMIGYNYNTTMADYYYLERGDQEPFGKNDGGGVATPKTEKEMKSDEFAELLGEDFVYDSGLNDGWLTLEWEE